MQKMDDGERLKKFEDDFRKLKANRERVPLKTLQTTYRKKYDALIQDVTAGGDWFADRYLEELLAAFHRHPEDRGGNQWLDDKIGRIIQEENRPGCMRDQWRTALVDKLNFERFEGLVYQRYQRCLNEALLPYWRRHCRKTKAGWIYNDIIRGFWMEDNTGREGCWISQSRKVLLIGYPPDGKEGK